MSKDNYGLAGFVTGDIEEHLRTLCRDLTRKGVPRKELLRVSRQTGTSWFSIPGTRGFERESFYKAFSSSIVGGVVGTGAGYLVRPDATGVLIGGLLGLSSGLLSYAVGQEDRDLSQGIMRDDLIRTYDGLIEKHF